MQWLTYVDTYFYNEGQLAAYSLARAHSRPSFYPIFPPPADVSSEVNLAMSHFDDVRMVDEGDLDYAPDVLILPSRLKQFSKVFHRLLPFVFLMLNTDADCTFNHCNQSFLPKQRNIR